MKRSSFLKSLIALVVVPKILSDIDFVKATSVPVNTTRNLFMELSQVTPFFYEKVLEKYGSYN